MTEKKCEFCDKRGLPVLLVRDAVTTAEAGAPKAEGSPIGLGQHAHYTKRLLRSGYVYVYDKARSRWEDYFVTAQGHFFKLAQTPGTAPIVPAKPFNCPDEGHRAVASCITIADPLHATEVWIGFSDVRWTDAVRKNHEAEDVRKLNMRKIDVKAALKGGSVPFAQPVASVEAVVAEYALDPVKAKDAFRWSAFEFDVRKAQAQRLKEECERLRPGKGLILTLPEPAGVVQELAALMVFRATSFLSKPEFKRKLAVSSAIAQIESGVKEQAVIDEIRAAEDLANQQVSNNPLGHVFFESTRKQTEALRRVTPDEADRAAGNAWKAYTKKYDEPARKKWQDNFNTEFTNFDAAYVAPLATAHTAWMQSQTLVDAKTANFDTEDIRSGIVWSLLYERMIAGTQDKKACFDLSAKWLEGSVMDRRNLLLSALVCNQDKLAKLVKEAAANTVDLRSLPWDKLIEGSAKASERLVAGEADAVGRIIAHCAGPFARFFINAANSAKVYEGLVAIGMAARHPVVAVEVTGGKKAFRASLIKQMLKLSGQKIDNNTIQKAVADEFRRLSVHGIALEGTEKKRFLLMIDPAEVRAMPSGLSKQAQAQWLASTIRTPEQIDDLNLHTWRQKLAGAGRGGMPFAFAALGLIAQYSALTQYREEEAKALQNNKSESLRRIYAQGAQVAGAVGDILGQGVAKLVPRVPQFAQGFTGFASKVLVGGGRALGVAGSLVMAAFDVTRGLQELDERNVSAGAAYLVSGFLGGAATLLLAIGWTGWGLAVVLVLIAWSFVMTHLVDNKVQDWLERVHEWGNLTDQRYPDFETEQSELRVALQPS